MLQQFFAYRRDAAGELQALLGTIAHNHHFIEFAGIVNERYLYRLLEIVDIHIQRTIAHILYPQCQWGFYLRLEGEVTVVVGNYTLSLHSRASLAYP